MIDRLIHTLGSDEKRDGSFSTTLFLRRVMYVFLIFWVIVMMLQALLGHSLNEHLELARFILFACGIAETSFQTKRCIEARSPQAYPSSSITSSTSKRNKRKRRRVVC